MSSPASLEQLLAAWDRTLDRAESCLREGDGASARLYLGQARAQLQSLARAVPVARLHRLGVFRRRSAEAIGRTKVTEHRVNYGSSSSDRVH